MKDVHSPTRLGRTAMRQRMETAFSVLLALAVAGAGCGICMIGTLAARGDLRWQLGSDRYRMWLIREREGAGLALSRTVPFRNLEGTLCQRTYVWFWLWVPRIELQQVDHEECPPTGSWIPQPKRATWAIIEATEDPLHGEDHRCAAINGGCSSAACSGRSSGCWPPIFT